MHKFLVLLSLGSIFLLVIWRVAIADDTHAQNALCFPETGHCIDERFRTYWETNGGLPVFGYPITKAALERNPTDGNTYLTQWFERHRLEWHPDHEPPYDIMIGHLGTMRLQELGGNQVVATHNTTPDTPYYFTEPDMRSPPNFGTLGAVMVLSLEMRASVSPKA